MKTKMQFQLQLEVGADEVLGDSLSASYITSFLLLQFLSTKLQLKVVRQDVQWEKSQKGNVGSHILPRADMHRFTVHFTRLELVFQDTSLGVIA